MVRAITKDNQTVGTTVTVFYKYNIGKISDIYREYGMTQIENITFKTVLESFKKVIGTYTIFEIANNQQDIITKMIESVKAESAKYPITITDVKITNFDWSDKFDAQIEATMARAQEVKQKEQELLVTENEANKRVKEAEATKQSMIKEAEGEYESAKIRAQAKILEGEGIRKYNESIAKNLNVEIKLKELEIQKIQAERWNGTRVPTYWYAPIPIQKLQNSVAE